jgi:peptide/nickel transport system permease protein
LTRKSSSTEETALATYVIQRVLASIPVLIAVSFLTFSFVVLTSDPLAQLRQNRNLSFETVEKVKQEKHLEEPFVFRYGYWVKDAVTERFGTTILGDRPIWPELKRVLGNTLQLVVVAEILALLLGIGIGVYSAVRQYSTFDYVATSASFLGLAFPLFWLALMLQILVTNIYVDWDVRLFYTAQLSSSDPGSGAHFVLDRIQHLALPWLTLMVVNIAVYSRFTRAAMLEVFGSDYVRTARGKGVAERRVVMKHTLRNALIPVIVLAGLNFGALLGGSIVAETIFALDGMGLYFINALGTGDPYPIMAWLMVTAVMIIVANLIADIALSLLDPRVRLS